MIGGVLAAPRTCDQLRRSSLPRREPARSAHESLVGFSGLGLLLGNTHAPCGRVPEEKPETAEPQKTVVPRYARFGVSVGGSREVFAATHPCELRARDCSPRARASGRQIHAGRRGSGLRFAVRRSRFAARAIGSRFARSVRGSGPQFAIVSRDAATTPVEAEPRVRVRVDEAAVRRPCPSSWPCGRGPSSRRRRRRRLRSPPRTACRRSRSRRSRRPRRCPRAP